MIALKRKALAALMIVSIYGIACTPSKYDISGEPAGNQGQSGEKPKDKPAETPDQQETGTACVLATKKSSPVELKGSEALIQYEFQPGQIKALCTKAIADAERSINSLIGTRRETCPSPVAGLMSFEDTMANYGDLTTQLIFMAYVSTDKALRDEASDCEAEVGKFGVSVFTRKDLYNRLKADVPRTSDEKRLHSEMMKAFEKNGLKLDDAKLSEVRELKKQLAELETQFSANLGNDTTKVEFTGAELEGVSESFLSKLPVEGGKHTVSTKTPDYVHVMENAKNSETRKKMLMAYLNRASDKNPQLLEQAIQLRQKIAALMGYKTWADYRSEGRMANSAAIIAAFSQGLKGKLAERHQADLKKLLDFKKSIDPTATKIEMWDISYLAYQLKKRDYSLDDDVIRQYFPADYVMKGMMDVYSTILGVEYKEVKDAKVWHPSVKLFAVYDKKSGKLVSHFYADMFPRDGKYGHAAAFTLAMGRQLGDGVYSKPISSIVANFAEPTADRPSLLNIDEVETLFHEFGHIMHQVLTTAPYASLSGTSVAQDFVEAPSQMLENWVWDKSILNRISGHYQDTNKKLPDELLQKILAAKDFNQGYHYTRQLFLGIMDFTMHTLPGAVDTTALHDLLYKEIIGIEPLKGNHFNGTFGHLMGGYDAGYYGYLWSEVYAQDMFTMFQKNGLLSEKTGELYRSIILEQGNMKEPLDLVKDFLKREPNNAAFYEKLGIKP